MDESNTNVAKPVYHGTLVLGEYVAIVGTISHPLHAFGFGKPSKDRTGDILCLTNEEAFYLAKNDYLLVHNGPSNIKVDKSNNSVVSTESLWGLFNMTNSRFYINYKVYEYFKDRSFIVKTGANFGVDYVLYRTLPIICHSEMCVIVADSRELLVQDIISKKQLLGLDRTMTDVMKLLLICYVVPIHSNSEDTCAATSSDSNIHVDVPTISLSQSYIQYLFSVEVKPVSVHMRRSFVHNSVQDYVTVTSLQQQYRDKALKKKFNRATLTASCTPHHQNKGNSFIDRQDRMAISIETKQLHSSMNSHDITDMKSLIERGIEGNDHGMIHGQRCMKSPPNSMTNPPSSSINHIRGINTCDDTSNTMFSDEDVSMNMATSSSVATTNHTLNTNTTIPHDTCSTNNIMVNTISNQNNSSSASSVYINKKVSKVKKRRDPNEVRGKVSSKYARFWQHLKSPPPVTTENDAAEPLQSAISTTLDDRFVGQLNDDDSRIETESSVDKCEVHNSGEKSTNVKTLLDHTEDNSA